MTAGRLPAMGLLVVAIFAALAHICVWPAHLHAGVSDGGDVAAAPHEHGDSHHHSGGGPAVHAASCDAVGAAGVSVPPAPAGLAFGAGDVPLVAERREAARAFEVPPAGASPPLFLLHAALLI